MAGSALAANVSGSAYNRYNMEEVLHMMDEPMFDGSEDDLDLDKDSVKMMRSNNIICMHKIIIVQ